MLRDDAITEVKRGLGFRKDTNLDNAVLSALQASQRELEGATSLPWFLAQEDQTISLVAGQQSYPLPEGFLRVEDDFSPPWLEDSAGNRSLGPGYMPFDEALDRYGFGGTAASRPAVVSVRNTVLTFSPTPDSDYTFYWHYYKQAELLTSNIENAWLANVPELLIGMAGLRTATRARDADAAAIFKAEAERWRVWLVHEMTARREAATRLVVGKYK